jgi:hypothetical protein
MISVLKDILVTNIISHNLFDWDNFVNRQETNYKTINNCLNIIPFEF